MGSNPTSRPRIFNLAEMPFNEHEYLPLSVLRHRTIQPAWFEDRLCIWIGRLAPKYRRVIEMRYGLAGNGPHTLQEIGDTLSLSRERVRQIERKSLLLLKRYTFERLSKAPIIASSSDGSAPLETVTAPLGLCAKIRSDYIQRQIAKTTIKVRDRNFAGRYHKLLGRYGFIKARNERKLLYRNGIWASFGRSYWILFNAKTAILKMGHAPSELRAVLAQICS